MKKSSWLLRTTILCGVSILAAPALAQTAPATPSEAPQTPSSPDAATQDDGVGIRDIIVTAQKRSDSIQKVPVAVTALSKAELDSPAIQDIRDFAGRVPSLSIATVPAAPSAAAISIRGISFGDLEKSFDPAVGVVVDGVFIGTNTGQLLDSFDLAGLEVLRGPQGTLFGRNTIGGVINITRTKPTDEAGARGSFGYSSYNTKKGRLVVNSGKIGDLLALKGFVDYDDTDGYTYNVTKKRHDGQYETLSGGLTALITPAAGVSAAITYEHERERGENVNASLSQTGKDVICAAPGVPGFAPAVECNRYNLPDHGLYTTFSNKPTPVHNDTDAITANIDVDLGGSFALTSITGYRRNQEYVASDFDSSSADFFDTTRAQTYRQFSQELRVVGDVSPWLNLLVGGYYFDSRYQLNQLSNFGAVLGGALGAGGPFQLQQFVTQNSKSYAGFGDARIKLSDKFTIGLGGRYTRDEKNMFNNYGNITALVKLSQPTYDGTQCVRVVGFLFPGVPAYGPATNCTGSASFGKFTWRANVNYQIDPNHLVYASYSKGFRSGGFNGRAASPTSLGPYQPEIVDSYEGGLKADWLGHTLRTNVAVYYTKYNNKQEAVVQATPPGSANPQETVVKNASSVNIKGVELEVIAQPERHFTFHGSFNYTDAKYDKYFNDVNGDNIPDNVSTLTVPRAPKVQWSAGIDYTHEMGTGRLDLSTTLRYESKFQTCAIAATPTIVGAVVTDPRCQTDDRENLNATLTYTLPVGDKSEIRLSVFGNNLTDNRGIEGALPVAGLLTLGYVKPPRTVGVELGFKF